MEKKYVLSVGYPIGFNFRDDVEYYNVQLNENIYPLNLLSAFIWMGALSGRKTKEDLYDTVITDLAGKGYMIGEDYTMDNLESLYYEMITASLLIEVGELDDIKDFLNNYSNLKLTRKGFGVGIDFEKIVVHEDGKDITISPFEYYIWQISVESRTLGQTYDEYIKSVSNSVSQMGPALPRAMV